MRCEKCPLFSSWNNENDRGESCGLFGDGWDSPFQYEDEEGTTQGCYIDRHYIEKCNDDYDRYLSDMADGMEEMLKQEDCEIGVVY